MSPAPGWARLRARFDDAALQAYTLAPQDLVLAAGGAAAGLGSSPGSCLGSQAWPALQAWCLAAPGQRFGLAAPALHAAAGAAARARALALQLDGSHALQARRSALGRWLLRLEVKLQDLQADDSSGHVLPARRIWDSGQVRGDAAALAGFEPRRPSFLVLDRGDAGALQAALGRLQQRAAGWACPVRVLWLLPGPLPPGAVVLPAV